MCANMEESLEKDQLVWEALGGRVGGGGWKWLTAFCVINEDSVDFRR